MASSNEHISVRVMNVYSMFTIYIWLDSLRHIINSHLHHTQESLTQHSLGNLVSIMFDMQEKQPIWCQTCLTCRSNRQGDIQWRCRLGHFASACQQRQGLGVPPQRGEHQHQLAGTQLLLGTSKQTISMMHGLTLKALLGCKAHFPAGARACWRSQGWGAGQWGLRQRY